MLKLTEVGNTKFDLLGKMNNPEMDIDENVDSKTNCIINNVLFFSASIVARLASKYRQSS